MDNEETVKHDDTEKEEITESERLEDIVELGSVTARSRKYAIHCLTIVGQMVCVDNELLY